MRKQRKVKACSCSMCKPQKMGWDNRWDHRERQDIKAADKLNQDYKRMEDNRA